MATRCRFSMMLAASVVLVAACGRANTDSGSAGRTPRESYESVLAGSVLPDDRAGQPVHQLPSDETDLSNYQAASWRMTVDSDEVGRVPVRFFVNFSRSTSGVVLITLDTTLTGHRLQPPFESATADSIAIAGLGVTERVAYRCRFRSYATDERLLGIVPDSTRERWMPARRAWLVDTTAVRIRPLRPEAVACMLDESPD